MTLAPLCQFQNRLTCTPLLPQYNLPSPSSIYILSERRNHTTMSRKLSNILDINQQLNTRWTVLVQVLETGHTQPSNAGDNYRRLLFTDTQGTKVFGLIFSSYLRYFLKTFKPYKRYYISNANLNKTQPHFRINSYEFSWSLTNYTLVEEYPENIPPILPCEFHFTPFMELHRHAESNRFQDVRGIVIKCFPSQEVQQRSDSDEIITKRDVIIVNEEKTLMILTMWGNFDDHEGRVLENSIDEAPMIFGMRLKATTFNTLSLTTKPGSGLLINPPVAENLQLHAWYRENKAEILQLLEKESYKDGDLLLPYPEEEDITPITEAIASLKTSNTAWVKGKLKLVNQDKPFSHTGCANCLKPLDADITWIVTCPSCKTESEVLPISRASVEINDGTGKIHGIISTPDIEKFIPFTPAQLKDAEEFGETIYDTIAKSIQSTTVVAYVRGYQTSFNHQLTTKFSIVKAHIAKSLPNAQPRKQKEPTETAEADFTNPKKKAK